MAFSRNFLKVISNSQNIRFLIIQAIVTQFCFGMFNVIWQPYLIKNQITFTQLGILQSVIMIFTGLGSIFWGRLSDRVGRKPAHIGSMVCRIIAVLFTFLARDMIWFIGFGVFIGLSASWTQSNPVTTTLVSESVEEDKMATAISLYTSAGTLVAVIAAPLGGYVAVNQGYYLIFLSCIIGDLFNTIVASIYLKETLSKTNDFTMDSDFSLKMLFLPEKEIFPFYLVSILTLFSWRLTFSNLNAILVDSYKLNTFQLGLMAGTFSLTWGLTQAPIGVFIDKYPKKLFFLLSQIGFLIIVLGYSFSQSFTVFLFLQAINGIAHSFGTPALTSMIMTRVNKEARATVLAKLSTIPQIVSVPAPILSGYFYDLFGFKFLLYLRFFILLMTIVIIVRFIESKN